MSAFQLALDVAKGKVKLTDLAPRAKRRVEMITKSYSEATLKDLATTKSQPSKIGQRTSQPRKVHTT